jgi:hypothetical protein
MFVYVKFSYIFINKYASACLISALELGSREISVRYKRNVNMWALHGMNEEERRCK